jgi:hypothetical protein
MRQPPWKRDRCHIRFYPDGDVMGGGLRHACYSCAGSACGNDYPRGLGGVFEFDALNRRGMMAIGRGVLSGDTTVIELFVL